MSSSRTSSTAATSTVESKKSFTVPEEYLEMYKKVTCEVCPEPKSFESTTLFYKHMATEHDIKIYKCTKCEASFHTYCPMRKHNLEEHCIGIFHCLPCNKWRYKSKPVVRFTSAQDLLEHMESTHPGPEFEVICPVCKDELVVPGDVHEGLASFTNHNAHCRKKRRLNERVNKCLGIKLLPNFLLIIVPLSARKRQEAYGGVQQR